ncbi:Fe-only nitrogenase subunit delta [Pararhodospirillum oryzae]|uniref:Nitrogenase iron-iron protein delta chain n=1 Tax=Pararhodospirillum oryzae TaxID=478448 RepID=A0A512H8D1_9PROT|nr:Fe-only nitrogenase subunit delta [Pararhodospirillum oryzae]GEO81660.1 nitrogenase iron-iron protein delta chain [Pararhodospirillum oryzae]
MTDMTKDRVEQLIDYIMKKCLWQFHSRNWDRERQNKGILGMTTALLCDEPVDIEDPKERCYWVDAVVLADAYRTRYPWINTLSKDEIRELMAALHARLDHLTITGSLNAELTDKNY